MVEIKSSEHIQGKSILVTGAAGLVGSSLVENLLEQNSVQAVPSTVYALGRNLTKLRQRFSNCCDEKHLRFVEADVSRNIPDIDVDYIVHAASPAHPLAYAQTPVEVMQANLLGTISALELARRKQARFLFLSSGEIYGVSDNPNCAFSEKEYGYIDILNSRSCYPESKRAAETLCASYHEQYGVDVVVARLCHVYGPAITETNSRADAQFLRDAMCGKDIVMKSRGEQVRSFCYVRDAVAALLCILIKGKSGEAYNVANRKSIASVRQYAETLAEICNVHVIYSIPSEVETKGYSKVMRAVLNAEKIEQLGWVPQYDLRSGLQDMVHSLRRNRIEKRSD